MVIIRVETTIAQEFPEIYISTREVDVEVGQSRNLEELVEN